jgi:membrane-associated phospholipid phosphatase
LLGVINAIVTNFWKISGHTMVATGLSLWLAFLYNEWFLLLLPTFVPLVSWARYRTKKHTIAQLVAGAVSMLIATPLVWLLFGAP